MKIFIGVIMIVLAASLYVLHSNTTTNIQQNPAVGSAKNKPAEQRSETPPRQYQPDDSTAKLLNSSTMLENHTAETLNNYRLLQPEVTLSLMQSVAAIEYCIGYKSILQQHGSIEAYANAFVNTSGISEPDAILQQYIPAKTSCIQFNNETETALLALSEQLLHHAADLGNESAKLRIAGVLGNKASFGKELYDNATRKQMYRQAVTLYRELAAKGHTESQAMLVVMLTDSVNFPEHYDINEASELVEQIKLHTEKDFTHLLYR